MVTRAFNVSEFAKNGYRAVSSLMSNIPSTPREKMLSMGSGALTDAELLTLLLHPGGSTADAVGLAASLLQPKGVGSEVNGFDGLAGLLNATAEDLKKVEGVGIASRCRLLAVMELSRRAIGQRLRHREVFASPGAIRQYLQMHLAARSHEVFAVIFVDVQNRLIAMEEMFRGTLTQTSVYPREVVLRALHHQSAAVILAHNHPSGSVQPSRADETLTQTLKSALALVDIRVLDHVIIGAGETLSMAERGLL